MDKNVSKQSYVSTVFARFREHSTIHGALKLEFLLEFLHQTLYYAFVVLGVTCLFAYLGWNTVAAYLGYPVETDVSFVLKTPGSPFAANRIAFPALLFCNNNQYFRSAVGHRPVDWTTVMLETYPNMNQPLAISEGQTRCGYDVGQPPPPPLSDFPDLLSMFNTYTQDLGNFMFNHNSNNSVVRCRWQQQELNCTEMFVEQFSDFGWCFTFNPSASYVNFRQNFNSLINGSTSSSIGQVNFYNGTNGTIYPVALQAASQVKHNLMVNMGGSRSGAELWMNVMADEYCTAGLQLTYGFGVFVVDRDAPALITDFQHGIELTPGFYTNIAIRQINIHRHTESIRMCVTNHSLYSMNNLLPKYTKDACQVQCFGELILEYCGCITYSIPQQVNNAILQAKAPSNWNEIRECGTNLSLTAWALPGETQVACQQRVLAGELSGLTVNGKPLQGKSFEAYLDVACNCPTECEEIRYEAIASSSIYPSPNQLQAAIAAVNAPNKSMSLTDFRKNYLIANFYMESTQSQQIDEYQQIMPMDLMNALGGTFGLCLGGSLISLVEILLLLYYLVRGRIDFYRSF